MKDKISAEAIVEENFKGLSKLITDDDLLIWYKSLIVTCIESYHQQSLQQILEEAGEELPDEKSAVTNASFHTVDGLSDREKILIRLTARWMRSEASKVAGRLKDKIATLETLNRVNTEDLIQLKEELARKGEQVRSLKYWVDQNKFEQYADSKGREIVNAFDLTEELNLILAQKTDKP